MKISRPIGYALLAMGHITQHQEQSIISSQDIARDYNIPLEYLLKILQQLVRANVLRSKRGPRGGFSLAKPTKKITMLQIIEAVDGPMGGQLNLVKQAPRERFSIKADKIYEKAIAQAKAVFEKAKLSDLMR